VGGTKPGLLAEDITKLLVCRQNSDSDTFEGGWGITNVDLETHKKQINVDYFFQNDLHESSESNEQGLDIHDFHVAVHCQGQFAIRPYGTSTQVFPWANEESQHVTLQTCHDFSSTRSITLTINVGSLDCCLDQEQATLQIPTTMINSVLDARFILTFGDCVCDSGDQLTCDAELSVTETVTVDDVQGIIDGLTGMVDLNEGLVCEDDGISTLVLSQNNPPPTNPPSSPHHQFNNSTVQISILNGSADNLSNESQNLSSCLDWVRPADWTPRNDPNWIPMNACCGPKKYNNNMSKCCSGNNVYRIYDDGISVCCNGMVFGGSACHL